MYTKEGSRGKELGYLVVVFLSSHKYLQFVCCLGWNCFWWFWCFWKMCTAQSTRLVLWYTRSQNEPVRKKSSIFIPYAIRLANIYFWFLRQNADRQNSRDVINYILTLRLSEEKLRNFSRVDHLSPILQTESMN